MDREKVIKETKDGIAFAESRGFGGLANTMRDTLELLKEQEEEIENLKQTAQSMMEGVCLLKEQEAVKPKSKVRHGANSQIQHFCGNCMTMLHGKPKYCSECGRSVKWE